ncbi:antimicrobial peptide, SdpC family [Chitinophaga terrae (ex Kim and Jung 2007)]|uniref:Antimicrobial peptide, SdpC family n=1 Tax=Chitinophaga terrae (ex Kim and Jung 2007) TaxID=408074 RepID=A0A1H4GCD8_9BACT|nr:hypothetical protein [Chitinophaga terrae (ex Kim and Jung 2007)]GEP93294.1 hypothetical protein CTE07_49390 [Chitinophaga terrae (ex Kim and Jung 2007)]SEB06961.1 antimicrobial peptide, SdpC family [Chitinophaga terrae (ex Kim and Jung 2007)]
MKKQLIKKLSISFVALLLFAIGVYMLIPGRSSQTEIYSGEELFAGILFMEGKVASKITAYKDIVSLREKLSHSSSAKRTIEVSEIIQDIKENDKDYFEKFKTEVTSGNPTSIDKALIAATELIKGKNKFKLIAKGNPSALDSLDNYVSSSIVLYEPIAVSSVVSVNSEASSTLLDVYLYAPIATGFSGDNSDRLKKEIIINQIASEFVI